MRILLAAIAVFFVFASSAEARTHHRHYSHHVRHHHYAHYTYRHGHYAAHRHVGHRLARTQANQGIFQQGFSGFGAVSSASGANDQRAARTRYHFARTEYHRGLGGRPAAWCGWYMRAHVGSDPGPQYNLARNWAHYGSNAGGPSVGAIVVWPHHVGKIVGRENGQWVVESGNDGHAVRVRPRSLAGAIAFRNAYAGI
jgi:hypothetical protein